MTLFPCAPVVLMGYRRPLLTANVFQAIRAARPPVLFLVMDGPNKREPDDQEAVNATRDVVENIDWETEVYRIYAEENLGLRVRVSSGLDEVFDVVDEAIILEDDCLPSADFFRFATELLEKYRSDERVGLISGFSRLRGRTVSEYSYDFSRDVRIWGWATWGRTWKSFSSSGDLTRQVSEGERAALIEQFPEGPRKRSMEKMLSHSAALDSWALPFAVHCISRGYLNPVPMKNLVSNIGLGASSTHTQFRSWVAEVPRESLNFPLAHPSHVLHNDELDRAEGREDMKVLVRFPLRHPLQAVSRVVSYLLLRLARRRAAQS